MTALPTEADIGLVLRRGPANDPKRSQPHVVPLDVGIHDAMMSKINLRRSPRTYVLIGGLVLLIAVLMLVSPNKEPKHFIFGALFLVGGLVSAFYLNRLVVDKITGEIVHQRGLIFPVFSERYPINRIRKIRISEKVIRKDNHDRTTYPVRLSGIRDAIVSNHSNPWFSRVIAEQLARRIGVPLDNRVYGVSSHRMSDELDTPVVRRWIRDHDQFDKPALPATTDLIEKPGPSSYELSLSAEFPRIKYVIAAFFLVAGLAVANIPPAALFGSPAYRWIAGIALLAGLMGLAFVGRSSLKMDSEKVIFRQGYAPFRHRIRIEEIEELVVARDGVIMIGDEKAVWVHWGKSKSDSDYLAAAIPYHLHRIGKQLNHEYEQPN